MPETPIHFMLLGAIVVASLLAGLCFARFWWTTKDRFFLYFAISFWIEGINRAYTGYMRVHQENLPIYYVVRLVAYTLILLAIWKKNRSSSTKT